MGLPDPLSFIMITKKAVLMIRDDGVLAHSNRYMDSDPRWTEYTPPEKVFTPPKASDVEAVNLDEMTKPALIEFAKKVFDLSIDRRRSETGIREQLQRMMNSLEE